MVETLDSYVVVEKINPAGEVADQLERPDPAQRLSRAINGSAGTTRYEVAGRVLT